MMVNVIPRLTEREEQRFYDAWQNEGMTWREAFAAVQETQAPRYAIWWRCDQAADRRWGYG